MHPGGRKQLLLSEKTPSSKPTTSTEFSELYYKMFHFQLSKGITQTSSQLWSGENPFSWKYKVTVSAAPNMEDFISQIVSLLTWGSHVNSFFCQIKIKILNSGKMIQHYTSRRKLNPGPFACTRHSRWAQTPPRCWSDSRCDITL